MTASRPVSESASQRLRVLIAGGGTGGHVIPALAIARELRDAHGAEVRFVGTARGLETKLVPEAGFPLELVRSGQLKNVSAATRVRTMLDVPLGVLRCIGLLRSFMPDVVVGVGGYASGPAMMAAIMLRVPTLAYEPNAVPGMANRLVGKYVSAAAVNFPETTRYFRNATATGVPVRDEIFAVPDRALGLERRLLITAGSNGAKIFNETLPGIAGRLLERVPGLTIVHQTGERALEATREAYRNARVDEARVVVDAFLPDMAKEYAAADLVLARAGSTVAELAAAGKPSLLVPLPTAADDHQRKNAELVVRGGAAEMLLQAELTPEVLLDRLVGLLTDGERLRTMGLAARAMGRRGALQKIGDMVAGLGGTPPIARA
ncbi:MAG TPA: undecaprenyldiphospho-muramoylpentapeptide beta-N-acetylglucosaminyltransferase [Edaphobacter sp.]|nr:undecaprenyldiphospho-muramoylpentapeptide beta-N-acetylglucosaminyltransferase [Edaphobacter sp.]